MQVLHVSIQRFQQRQVQHPHTRSQQSPLLAKPDHRRLHLWLRARYQKLPTVHQSEGGVGRLVCFDDGNLGWWLRMAEELHPCGDEPQNLRQG